MTKQNSIKKILFVILLWAAMPANTSAQAKIEFDKMHHNFGIVQENENYIYHKFIVTNTGSKPLLINRVETSCGCTSPDWTKDSIQPGKTGFVQARYETINRVGPFTKTLTVYSNADVPFHHLDITGDVKASEKKPEAEPEFAGINYGFLSFSTTKLDFGNVYDNGLDTQFVAVTNESDLEVSLSKPVFECNCLTVVNFPDKLEPRETRKFFFVLTGSKVPYYGPNGSTISITSNHPAIPYYGFNAYYNKKEYFPKMSKGKLKKQPHLWLDATTYSWDSAMAGDMLQAKFTFKNTGKKPLIIREIKPGCGCVTPQFKKNELQAGESMTVVFFYDTIGKHGNSSQKIDIITNDPSGPEKQLLLKLILEKKSQKCLTCPPK